MAHGIPIGDAGEEVARERPPRMWSLYLHIFRVGRPRGQRLFVLSHVCRVRLTETIKEGCYLWGERNLYALVNYKREKHTWALGLGVRRTDRETER